MPRRRKDQEGGRRLLDAWEPPLGAGEPVGCVATTYTFDPVFFEEHCLSRFLRLETDPREDGAAYLIEREERLALTRVSVLVDRSHAQGSASPRWDVLPVAVPGAIFHPKLAVLAWQGFIRVIIGSANLTEIAYRRNQEIFGMLDFRDGGNVPIGILNQTLAYLGRVALLTPGAATRHGSGARLLELLERLTGMSQGWRVKSSGRGQYPQVLPMFLGPAPEDRTPILTRLGRALRERGGPGHSAYVLSPFFDRVTDEAYPATTALLAALTDRGQRYVQWVIPADRLPDDRLRLRAPRSVLRSARKKFEHAVHPLTEDADGEIRPVHAKAIWLWNDSWSVYMIGSSNFTSAGLGLDGHAANVEANLAFVFPEDTSIIRQMEQTFPPFGDPIEDLDSVLWEPAGEVAGEETGQPLLPSGFEEALFQPGEDGGLLWLHLGQSLPDDWRVLYPDVESFEYSARHWAAMRRPAVVELPWNARVVPRALNVQWRCDPGTTLSALWPVNVTDPGLLAPPDELRNLSLETLIEILGSRLPLHEAVLKARQTAARERARQDLPPELDPHLRVRTETFLLQRTRRVARAIEHLVERLNRPVAHFDGLNWRLRGPVGPLALARALAEAACSPGEACFLLAEVALALRRVDVRKVADGLALDTVRGAINSVIDEINWMARERLAAPGVPEAMVHYVGKALAAARR
jgi:hypothetical protein